MVESQSLLTLDVRDILKAGGEPLSDIMLAVGSLAPGQGLRLLDAFKPVPLFGVMSQHGFSHVEREIGGGDWKVVFSSAETGVGIGPDDATGSWSRKSSQSAKVACVDLRGLAPSEALQRALGALEALKEGELLQVLTEREPKLLAQELGRRYHALVTEPCTEGYRTTIQHSGASEERA